MCLRGPFPLAPQLIRRIATIISSISKPLVHKRFWKQAFQADAIANQTNGCSDALIFPSSRFAIALRPDPIPSTRSVFSRLVCYCCYSAYQRRTEFEASFRTLIADLSERGSRQSKQPCYAATHENSMAAHRGRRTSSLYDWLSDWMSHTIIIIISSRRSCRSNIGHGGDDKPQFPRSSPSSARHSQPLNRSARTPSVHSPNFYILSWPDSTSPDRSAALSEPLTATDLPWSICLLPGVDS